ncbi:MAG: S26 family signal peptidase [Pseudoruegeria sp.]
MATITRKIFGGVLVGLGLTAIYVLDRATIIFNVTTSLPENAFVVFDPPVPLVRGSIMAFQQPEALEDLFGDGLFVKRLVGKPGDEIIHREDGTPCIKNNCFPLETDSDGPRLKGLDAGVIPQDHFAVFGDSHDSLDSRYAMIGLVRRESLIGSGFAIPLPHWKEIANWF